MKNLLAMFDKKPTQPPPVRPKREKPVNPQGGSEPVKFKDMFEKKQEEPKEPIKKASPHQVDKEGAEEVGKVNNLRAMFEKQTT
jgi:hypothetical protein